MQVKQRLREFFKPPVRTRSDAAIHEELQQWRSDLTQGLLRVVALVGPFAVGFSLYGAYSRGYYGLIPIYAIPYLLVVALTLWPKSPYLLRSLLLVILLYLLGFTDLFQFGWREDARLFFICSAVLSAMFFGVRSGVLMLGLSLATLLGVGFASLFDVITLPTRVEPVLGGFVPISLLSDTTIFLLLGALLIVVQNYLIPRFVVAMAQGRALAQQLETQQAELEARTVAIQEVNYALQRRAMQLEAGAAVGQAIASIFDLQQLLDRTVSLISSGFGFYHTGIFLLDDSGERAVLRAASSEGGRVMLARGHYLPRGEGMVGWVLEHRQSRIAFDVGADAIHFANPDLPATRSEMALPIMAGGRLLGVLNVQSTEEAAFDQDDVRSLESLTGQLAVAIENARRVTEEAALLEATSPFYRLSRRFATARSRHEVYTAIVDTVRESQPYRVLLALSTTGERVHLAVELRGSELVFPKARQNFSELSHLPALYRYLTAQQQPLLITNFAELPIEVPPEQSAPLGRFAQALQVRSLAVVPISIAGALPALLLIAFQDQHRFTPAEEQLYRTLSDIAAVALQRLDLLEASQRRVEQELRLREFSDQMLGIFDLQVMVAQAARSLQTLVDADGVIVALERVEVMSEGASDDAKS